jgi:hypothetical protein
MMLWLVTFMSVIPAGLFLAHREHVSLTRLEEESEEEIEEIGLSEHPVTASSENHSSPNPNSLEDSGPDIQ